MRQAWVLVQLLASASWHEWRAHPLRHATVVLAVALGVALALAVHLINESALAQAEQAARQVQGQSDATARGRGGAVSHEQWQALLVHGALGGAVAAASPLVELATPMVGADGKRHTIRVLGVDALSIATVNPALMPRGPVVPNAARELTFLQPGVAYPNAAALALLAPNPQSLQLQSGMQLINLRIAGGVAASGMPTVVMDIAAAQDLFSLAGASRVELQLAPGRDAQLWRKTHQAEAQALGLELTSPDTSQVRLQDWSRAYRVNLSVLSLIALFTGAYLVYSVLSLGVTKRAPQLALLGVLGMARRERGAWVLAEALLLGAVGSALGLVAGALLAWAAVHFVGGDLGGGYFSGGRTALHLPPTALATFGTLGVAAAALGAWWPARAASQLSAASALKGLGATSIEGATDAAWRAARMAMVLIVAAALLAAPPVLGLPLAAYTAMGLGIFGTVGLLPPVIAGAASRLHGARSTLLQLAAARAQRVQQAASVAVSGVVASVALAVAITIMVSSFRTSVMAWLDAVLPAPLYIRSAASAVTDATHLSPQMLLLVAQTPGVASTAALRLRQLSLTPERVPVTAIAMDVDIGGPGALPIVDGPYLLPPAAPGERVVGIAVSEAMRDLYGQAWNAFPNQFLNEKLPFWSVEPAQAAAFLIADQEAPHTVRYFVQAVVRDYARQHGTIQMRRADYVAITGDERVNDLSLQLAQGYSAAQVQKAIEAQLAVQMPQAQGLLTFARADEIRALSLKIFDRSFAVTTWLQAVVVAIGLFGVAASFSAQVLSRRKEFGLMAHLGFTRVQVLQLVAAEGGVYTACGAAVGVTLGVALGWVLVHVVNPQSFRWTMPMQLPWARMGLLWAAVVACGALTAWLTGRAAVSHSAVVSVKEDW